MRMEPLLGHADKVGTCNTACMRPCHAWGNVLGLPRRCFATSQMLQVGQQRLTLSPSPNVPPAHQRRKLPPCFLTLNQRHNCAHRWTLRKKQLPPWPQPASSWCVGAGVQHCCALASWFAALALYCASAPRHQQPSLAPVVPAGPPCPLCAAHRRGDALCFGRRSPPQRCCARTRRVRRRGASARRASADGACMHFWEPAAQRSRGAGAAAAMGRARPQGGPGAGSLAGGAVRRCAAR